MLKAVLTEPLRAGRFFHTTHGHGGTNCTVCAVGAILRQALNKKDLADDQRRHDAVHAACRMNYNAWDTDEAFEGFREDPNTFLQYVSAEFEYASGETRREIKLKDPMLPNAERRIWARGSKYGLDIRTHLYGIIEAFAPETVTIQY